MRPAGRSSDSADLPALERSLRDRIRADEARFTRGQAPADSLWDHVRRVAVIAERLASSEAQRPIAGRLAGLFHDAGKFAGGRYHDDDLPEERRSVQVLRELGSAHDLDSAVLAEVEEAILQLYLGEPDPSPLARVLFDADNLDKLGPLGVANYFTKAGLRGDGVSRELLHRATVELTYARCAPQMLWTEAGRALAARRGPATTRYFLDLFETLREDGLEDFRIEDLVHDGLTLVVAAPARCSCGSAWERAVTEERGMKCSTIRLEHHCPTCGDGLQLRLCRPRLVSPES